MGSKICLRDFENTEPAKSMQVLWNTGHRENCPFLTQGHFLSTAVALGTLATTAALCHMPLATL